MVPYETVVAELEADTINVRASLGSDGVRFIPGPFPEAVFICIKVLGEWEERERESGERKEKVEDRDRGRWINACSGVRGNV